MYRLTKRFQSTHLLRGATFCLMIDWCAKRFQSTHLLRGATQMMIGHMILQKTFQSTHLLRGATGLCCSRVNGFEISIHAPLTRCDSIATLDSCTRENFNPRTSYEVRPLRSFKYSLSQRFQSTHLLRGATKIVLYDMLNLEISIHAPLTRCDATTLTGNNRDVNFNPRTSYEVRRNPSLS